jgi:hypothetical protein
MVGGKGFPVNERRRQWIAQEKLGPGPVPFAAKNVELWLPKSVEVYLHFRGRRYYRRHTFERFMLFSVDSEEKVRQPEADSHGPGSVKTGKR